jgi:hypothetical protein
MNLIRREYQLSDLPYDMQGQYQHVTPNYYADANELNEYMALYPTYPNEENTSYILR